MQFRQLDPVLASFARHGSWHVRQAVLPFMQLLAFSHLFILPDPRALYEYVIGFLSDPHVEVRIRRKSRKWRETGD